MTHKCYCELDPGQEPDACVFDDDNYVIDDCVHAQHIGTPFECEYYRDTELYEGFLDEKRAEISILVEAIREIYAIAGEDKQVSDICNRILESRKFDGY